jgi:hypothetical protein
MKDNIMQYINNSKFNIKIIFLSILILIIVSLSATKYLDKNAYNSNISSAKEVAIYLVTTRGLNAILSVVENSSFNVGIGINVEIALGQIVNPINDFLDRFSWILLLSLISLGIQKFILIFIETNILTVLLIVFGFLTIFGKIYIKYNNKIFIKLLVLFTFIRLAVPFMELSNSYVYDTIMKKELQVIHTKMSNMEYELKKLLPNQNNDQKTILTEDINSLKQQKNIIISKYKYGLFKKVTTYFKDYDKFSQVDQNQLKDIDKAIENKTFQLKNLNLSLKKQFEVIIKKIDTMSEIYFEEAYNAIFMFLLRAIFFPILFLYFFAKILRVIFDEV